MYKPSATLPKARHTCHAARRPCNPCGPTRTSRCLVTVMGVRHSMKATPPKKNSKDAKESATSGPQPKPAGGLRWEDYPAEHARLFSGLEPLIVASLHPEFADDGLRIIKLWEPEWNFSGLDTADDQIVTMAARHEYMREIPGQYEVARDLFLMFRGQSRPAAFFAKWKWRAFFPAREVTHFRRPLTVLPWMVIQQFIRLKYTGKPYLAVREIGADDVSPLWSGETRHRIEIDWNKGIDAIQSDMRAWARTVAPKDVRSRRGRSNRKQIEDGLAQLAAWRARRAGLTVRKFNELLEKAAIAQPEKGSRELVRRYADSSAYRTAATAAETRIKETNRDYKSHWEKTVQENRDYWGGNCQAVRDSIQRMTKEAETFRVQMEQKKREAESFLSELEQTERKAKKSPEDGS